jgi:hypothetical protein
MLHFALLAPWFLGGNGRNAYAQLAKKGVEHRNFGVIGESVMLR